MAYGIVVTENLSGTHNPVDLVSVRYAPSGTNAAIDNGNVVLVGALEAGQREIHAGTTPAANSAKADIALVASPEVIYDEREQGDLSKFQNAAGDILRCYRLEKPHQAFAISGDALDGAAARIVGAIVELQAGTKLKAVASLTASTTKIGVITDVYTKSGVTYYAIETA